MVTKPNAYGNSVTPNFSSEKNLGLGSIEWPWECFTEITEKLGYMAETITISRIIEYKVYHLMTLRMLKKYNLIATNTLFKSTCHN